MQNMVWLSARILPTIGKAMELCEYVMTYMSAPGGSPPILPISGGPLKVVLNVMCAMKVLVLCNLGS